MTLTASDALMLLSSEPRLQYEQKPLRRFGVADVFRWDLGGREPLQAKDGLDATSLINDITAWVQDGAVVN